MLTQLVHWTEELSGREAGKTWKRIEVTSNCCVAVAESINRQRGGIYIFCSTDYYAVQG